MSKDLIHERLASARLAAGFETASDAARAFGWNENTYRSHENGERGIKNGVAEKYSKAFNVSFLYLLTGKGYEEMEFSSFHAPIMGVVGSKLHVDFRKYKRTRSLLSFGFTMAHAEAVAELTVDLNFIAIALEVGETDPPYQLEPGSLLLVEDEPLQFEKARGLLCLIETEARDYYIRHIPQDEEAGRINLRTMPWQQPHFVVPTWIAAVALIVPRGRWQRFTRKQFLHGRSNDDDAAG